MVTGRCIWPTDYPWETVPGVVSVVRHDRIAQVAALAGAGYTAPPLIRIENRLPGRFPQVLLTLHDRNMRSMEFVYIPAWVQFCVAWHYIESSLGTLTDDECRAMGVAFEVGGKDALKALWEYYDVF